MSMSDPLRDMLTRIRNAQRAKKSDVVSPASRLREKDLEVLKREGYIEGWEKNNKKKWPKLQKEKINLRYYYARLTNCSFLYHKLDYPPEEKILNTNY